MRFLGLHNPNLATDLFTIEVWKNFDEMQNVNSTYCGESRTMTEQHSCDFLTHLADSNTLTCLEVT